MRFYISIVLVFFSLVVLQSQSSLSFAQAKTQAQRENQNLFIFFTADWCLPCEMMKKGAFADQRIRYMLHEGFVSHQIDEDDFRSTEWTRQFGVSSIPVCLILDPNGNELLRINGFTAVDHLYHQIRTYCTVNPNNVDLNGVASIFESKPSRDFRRNIRAIVEVKHKPAQTVPSIVKEENSPQVVENRFAESRLSLYGVQLNSFGHIADAIAYQSYIKNEISDAKIFTSEAMDLFNIVVECNSLREAREKYLLFKRIESNCFVRIL